MVQINIFTLTFGYLENGIFGLDLLELRSNEITVKRYNVFQPCFSVQFFFNISCVTVCIFFTI